MQHAIRSMFVAPKGKSLLAFDLSQAETWIVAYLANEPNMKDALLHGDIHTLTAQTLFDKIDVTKEERYIGKRCNHALSYRMSAGRMAEVINKDAIDSGISISLSQAKFFHIKWHSFYTIKQWWLELESQLRSTRMLRTVYGRTRTFYASWGDELFKEATAYLPQSTVGDHALGAIHPDLGIKGGVREIHHRFHNKKDVQVINTSHDSVMLEVPTSCVDEIAPQVYALFKRPLIINNETFMIPVDGEVGERWGELEKIPKEKLNGATSTTQM